MIHSLQLIPTSSHCLIKMSTISDFYQWIVNPLDEVRSPMTQQLATKAIAYEVWGTFKI